MLKTITLLLTIGTLSTLATAQRGVCARGNDVNQTCPQVQPADPAPGGSAVQLPDPTQPATGELQSRGRGNGQGRGARRGQGQGNGRGNGAGRGRGNGRGNGAGKGQGNGRGNGKGRGRGAGRKGGGCGGNGQGRGNGRGGCGGICLQLSAAPTTTGDSAVAPAPSGNGNPAFLRRLQATLEAELYARDYYKTAARALNGFRRFQNLSGAEQNHANAIASAIESLGGRPKWIQEVPITPPQSIDEADEHCRGIELHVIDVYEGLIEDAPSDQLRTVFQNIQKANYQHLKVVGG